MKPRLFIVNPAAGAGQALTAWKRLAPELSSRGLGGEHLVTSRPGEASDFAAQAAPEYATIVAVGGDGTASEVASGLLASANPRAALAVVPCGTGNDIAQNLGVGSHVQALAALQANVSRLFDTIAITCKGGGMPIRRHALLFAAAGIIGLELRFTTSLSKRILGRRLAYRLSSLCALLAYRPQKLRVQCDGRVFEERFLYVGAHNTETFGGGMCVAPGAVADDGLLNVNLVSSVGRLEAVSQFRRLCRGTHTSHPAVRYFTAGTLSIHSPQRVDVAADGDLIGLTPAQFTVCPRSLSVLCPP